MLRDLILSYELSEHASIFSNDIEPMNGNAENVQYKEKEKNIPFERTSRNTKLKRNKKQIHGKQIKCNFQRMTILQQQ